MIDRNYEFRNACREGDLELVESLIDQVDINTKDYKVGDTPLLLASLNGYTKIVELLLNTGADPHYKNNNGNTALMIATRKTNVEIVKLLIKSGINIDHQNDGGDTALIIAARNDNLMMAEQLDGANRDIVNINGKIAFDYVLSIGCDKLLELTIPESFDFFDKDGKTFLMKSCENLNVKSFLFLYEKGANIFKKSNKDKSAYDILISYKCLPPSLQALKEKLILDQLINNEECLTLSL